MESEKVREILREGADVYSVGMMSGFDRWAKEHPALNGERALVDFYLEEVSSRNSGGTASRLYSIDSRVQQQIFDEFISSQEGR